MNALIDKLLVTSPKAADVALLVVRVSFGLAMAFAHGWGKITDLEKLTAFVAKKGFPMPEVLGPAAAFSEFFCALLMAIGAATRPAAALLGITMLNAAIVVHADDPFSKKEKALAYAIVSIALVIAGAGQYSVDAWIARRREPER